MRSLGIWSCRPALPRERLQHAVEQRVDRVVDPRAHTGDDLADLGRDAGQAKQLRNQVDRHRQQRCERPFDLGCRSLDDAMRDIGEAFDNRLRDLNDAGELIAHERVEVPDREHQLDERANRAEQAGDPRDAGDDDLLDEELLDPADHVVHQTAEVLRDAFPQCREAAVDERLHVAQGEFQAGDVLFADEPHRLFTNPVPGQTENLPREVEYAGEIEFGRDLDARRARR